MRRSYTLKSGEVINCYYKKYAGCIIILDEDDNEKEVIDLPYGDTKATFEYHGETICIDDYDFMTVRELLAKCREKAIENGDDPSDMGALRENDLLTTLLKDTENFGIVDEVECYNTIIPGLGIAFKGTGSAKFKVLTVPFEHNYKKEDWNYKVEFKPANPDIAKVTGRETYYLSDIVSHIRRGYAQLVDIRDFQEEAKRLDNIALNTEARIGVL